MNSLNVSLQLWEAFCLFRASVVLLLIPDSYREYRESACWLRGSSDSFMYQSPTVDSVSVSLLACGYCSCCLRTLFKLAAAVCLAVPQLLLSVSVNNYFAFWLKLLYFHSVHEVSTRMLEIHNILRGLGIMRQHNTRLALKVRPVLTCCSVWCVQVVWKLRGFCCWRVRDHRASCRRTDRRKHCHVETEDELSCFHSLNTTSHFWSSKLKEPKIWFRPMNESLWTYGWWWWGERWMFGRWTDRAAELCSDRNQSLMVES